ERRIGSAEVTGPIPVSSSFFESAGSLIFQGVRLFYITGNSRGCQRNRTPARECKARSISYRRIIEWLII
ncbi:hypothetical protein, partial [Clostridium sp.]|uniref:hypothetical protein n=1 Tax=Clostridium sp. TaxID=1506 RepID=UPI00257C8B04